MQCMECGATFIPRQSDQRFCCPAHNSRYRQKAYRQREQVKHEHMLNASSDLDTLKQENEHLKGENEDLKRQNEQWKEVIRRHHNERDSYLEKIENLENAIKERNKEIERLKLARAPRSARKQTRLISPESI